MSNIDVLVLRRETHGMPASDYATALRNRLPDATVEVTRTPREERDLVPDAQVISSVDIDEELLERADDLELLAGVAAGYDHLPLELLAEHGVAVTNASGIHAPNIAEHVLGDTLQHSELRDRTGPTGASRMASLPDEGTQGEHGHHRRSLSHRQRPSPSASQPST